MTPATNKVLADMAGDVQVLIIVHLFSGSGGLKIVLLNRPHRQYPNRCTAYEQYEKKIIPLLKLRL